ncbi:MAG: bifunctional hydroxymethylpyrimidine kinase/phosphomethylpyrimidine kinase [Bacillota bacterium]
MKFVDGIPRVLAIGGSDPGGGAGIQADLKVMAQIGVYGAAAVTALTRQTTREVIEVFPLPPNWVLAQVEDVLWDLRPAVVKTGMLQSAGIIRGLARLWGRYVEVYRRENTDVSQAVRFPALVVDPVLHSGTGVSLLTSGGMEAFFKELLPLAAVVTPNVPEAEALTGIKIPDAAGMKRAAAAILASGVQWVLLKGGHLPGQGEIADLLCSREKSLWLKARRVPEADLHGTGCTLASALASFLARGMPPAEAAKRSTRWVRRGIARPLTVGHGKGVVCQQRPLNCLQGFVK